ncbi:MlaA family lipoprotein [Xylophilus ampelinus]|uniref:Phospholipid-binding lipoprotein MlaA n=1 Tax=Xylophilus ampelinus TaxID=54067 RepID=A0A318SHC1_9BURK|nr:phospholipid-binding lipoprotein MlaA [Xylophilus ampelinus]
MKTTSHTLGHRAMLILALAGGLLMAGCASSGATTGSRNPRDPFEPFNRGVSEFNERIDDAVVRPVATVYRDVTPPLVRTGVGNFFRNLTEPWSLVNNVLQLKIRDAGETWIRFAVNTVFGLGGVLDIAGAADIDQHRQDFGQTLAFYGVPTGPYLVLPLLGPSTVRDTATFTVDTRANLLSGIDNIPVRNSLYVLRAVDVRANLLRASSVLDAAALDKYTFTRDAYLQLRRNQPRNKDTTDSDGDGYEVDNSATGAGAAPAADLAPPGPAR